MIVTVPAVRAALITRFTANLASAGLSSIPVVYGHPGQDVPAAFVSVSTSDGVDRQQKRMPLLTTSMEEDYGLTVIVWHLDGDHTRQQQVAEAAWLTASTLEAGLRAETTLGGLVQWALFTRFDDEDFLLKEGRAAQITCTVTIHKTRA